MFVLEKHDKEFILMDVYEEEGKTSCIVASTNIDSSSESEKNTFISIFLDIVNEYDIDMSSLDFLDCILLNNLKNNLIESNKELKIQYHLSEAVIEGKLKGDYLNVNLIDVKDKDYFVVYVDYKTSNDNEFIEWYLNDISYIKKMFKDEDFGKYTHLCICPYSNDSNGNFGLWNTLIFHTNGSIYDMFKHHFSCF